MTLRTEKERKRVGPFDKEKREKGTGERKEGALVKRGVREWLTVRDCFGLKERESYQKPKEERGRERRFGLLKTVGRFLLLIMFVSPCFLR